MHLSRKANTDTNWFPKIRNNTILICICIPTHLTILYISQTTPFLIRHQYSLCKAGNRVYEDGVISRLLFDGGYVSFRDSVPTYHYYIRDYLGNNRVVADAHGNVEEVNHYYPWRAHGRQPQHRPAALQVHRKGSGPHPRPGLVRPRCPPLRPVTPIPLLNFRPARPRHRRAHADQR